MQRGTRISFSSVNSSLSSLKNCQSYINTGMDIATHVALDLVENFRELSQEYGTMKYTELRIPEERRLIHHHLLASRPALGYLNGVCADQHQLYDDEEDVRSMENVMLEYAALDRELNHYMRAIEETVDQIKQDKPEKIPDLKSLVKEKFTALESMNSDSDLEKNEKYMYFKDQLKDMKKQFRLQSDSNDNDDIEQIDEDIAVTQSQMNFICPITQVEMKKPVRNKVCGHSYEEDAILKIIQTRKQQKKKVRCPKIGCSHDDVKGSDLVPDEALKRAIDSQNKQSWSTL